METIEYTEETVEIKSSKSLYSDVSTEPSISTSCADPTPLSPQILLQRDQSFDRNEIIVRLKVGARDHRSDDSEIDIMSDGDCRTAKPAEERFETASEGEKDAIDELSMAQGTRDNEIVGETSPTKHESEGESENATNDERPRELVVAVASKSHQNITKVDEAMPENQEHDESEQDEVEETDEERDSDNDSDEIQDEVIGEVAESEKSLEVMESSTGDESCSADSLVEDVEDADEVEGEEEEASYRNGDTVSGETSLSDTPSSESSSVPMATVPVNPMDPPITIDTGVFVGTKGVAGATMAEEDKDEEKKHVAAVKRVDAIRLVTQNGQKRIVKAGDNISCHG